MIPDCFPTPSCASATELKPDVASMVVGINDTLRGNFDPQRTGAAVARTVAGLRAAGAQVLTMRLPDPGPGTWSRRCWPWPYASG